MAYEYFIVESTYLVRWGNEGCEYIKPDGTWHEYADEWNVQTNGRLIGDDEELAMKKAKALFAELDEIGFKYPD